MHCLALAAPGTLDLVAAECRSLGLRVAGVDGDGVTVDVDWHGVVRGLIGLRVASRWILHLGTFAAHDGESLYRAALRIDWAEWLDLRCTFAVFASGDTVAAGTGPDGRRSAGLVDLRFVALRVKDAIADDMTRRFLRRPDVDRDDPTVAVLVRGRRGNWSFYLDLSDPPLHMRGTRVAAVGAPLKENLAAAVVDLSGWSADQPLVDPLCGSATIAIEAATKALAIAPGCTRTFAVEGWPHHGRKLRQWLDAARATAVAHAKSAVSGPAPSIAASDVDDRAVTAARANVEAAGLTDIVEVERRDARDLPNQRSGTVVVCNPPYGERIGAEVDALYAELGAAWRGKGVTAVHALALPDRFAGPFGWPVDRRARLNNGGIDVELVSLRAPPP